MGSLFRELRSNPFPKQPEEYKNSTILRLAAFALQTLLAVLLASCVFLPRSSPVFLRTKPALVSRADLNALIQSYKFNHPTDLTEAGLSGRVQGTFQHQYALRTISEADVIVDKTTHLMWQQSGSAERMTWMEAKASIDHLNSTQFAGYSDWRLPTIEELASLLEFSLSPANPFYIDPLFDATQSLCWSADVLDSAANVWFVYFAHGYISHTDAESRLYVRAVRSNENF